MTAGAPDDARVPGAPVAEILGILLDNARVHGRGTVRLTVRDLDAALAFEGGLTSDGDGIGLAQDLTQDRGGDG